MTPKNPRTWSRDGEVGSSLSPPRVEETSASKSIEHIIKLPQKKISTLIPLFWDTNPCMGVMVYTQVSIPSWIDLFTKFIN
jgi:hypothetical protein